MSAVDLLSSKDLGSVVWGFFLHRKLLDKLPGESIVVMLSTVKYMLNSKAVTGSADT